MVFEVFMGGRSRKKRSDSVNNKRLDIFFNQIEAEVIKKNIEKVEDLTFSVLKGRSESKLRLKKD